MDSLYYNDLFITLYEEPEGTPRPRARLVNRYNMSNMALKILALFKYILLQEKR